MKCEKHTVYEYRYSMSTQRVRLILANIHNTSHEHFYTLQTDKRIKMKQKRKKKTMNQNKEQNCTANEGNSNIKNGNKCWRYELSQCEIDIINNSH